jgi:hypothetical protein
MEKKRNYLKDIAVIEDKKYSRSYGPAIETRYPLGYEEGNWLHLYAKSGAYVGKKKTNAIHFHHFIGGVIGKDAWDMRLQILRDEEQERIKKLNEYYEQQKQEREGRELKFAVEFEKMRKDGTLYNWTQVLSTETAASTNILWDVRCAAILGVTVEELPEGAARKLRGMYYRFLDNLRREQQSNS